ncbi:multicopper oxidase domain-containing protein [Alienimonas sp. DA493]|uniref:multicopper oxidase domain-containing protein n=1 Tax=Alienimonas sp. DA493 TaxID=3373605 RepID=UPI00375456A4
MSASEARRSFLKAGTAAAAGAFAARAANPAAAQENPRQDPTPAPGAPTDPPGESQPRDENDVRAEYDGFNRYVPSRGHDPDSKWYIGKEVPGFRKRSDGPAPFVAPDLEKLPHTVENGWKVFHLTCEPVRREFLPGYFINVYGYNGSMPGPTIEVTQGDKVRIVVKNDLPEPTVQHWHGFELPVQYDGAAHVTQNMIPPGKEYVYEFHVHEEGTFFYHSHVAMQEAFGMVGWFIVHPKTPFDPPVDRDFGLIFQNFRIDPMTTVVDSWGMDFNWHTINGRSGPYTTPLVCRHGERVRIRIMDFSPIQHHPIHMHGHTFWVTGHEGARIPKTAWVPRNTELIAVAQASNLEFVANNPGDWVLHCHMVHHMMNHMVQHVGPRLRGQADTDRYTADLDTRPAVDLNSKALGDVPPGYPQMMQGMKMDPRAMEKVWNRREMKGMRATAPKTLHGLFTAVRVLPDDLYHLVMETDEPVEKGAVFAEIVRRFGDYGRYDWAPMMDMGGEMNGGGMNGGGMNGGRRTR